MTSSFYINAKRFAVEPLVKTAWRPWVKGLDNIPEEGGAILAANHLSFFDSVLVPVVVPRPVSYLAKKDYWEMKGAFGAFNRWFFTATGQIPMDRSGGAASADSLRHGEEALKQGHLLGIYPEGTRSPTASSTEASSAWPSSPCAPKCRSYRSRSSEQTKCSPSRTGCRRSAASA
ncbi:1-acyl-sn-glycerol-3-phosphate acyltransferase [Nesterenkonia pannonica]|uniref:lysophospholipid acyltransferase family protein n=1 Tax=Nesterenkonia pannonica TaxID=1548602 RepID=UPI002164B551|nr:lysophospholipid acyltransferase family protein [Nesterenkonia pannonica]